MTDDNDGNSDETKRRNEQLAKELLETLKTPGMSPDRAAFEVEKDATDKAALEDYYRRTGQTKDKSAKARSGTEMLFAASLEPCPNCGATEVGKLDIVGSGTSWSVTGTCPRCSKVRSHAWETEGNPVQAKTLPRQLGDERPSAIIRVSQFIAELDRLLPHVRPSPEQLQPMEWRSSLSAIERVLTCLLELLKFVPSGMQIIPDTKLTEDERKDRTSRAERYKRAWLQGEIDRVMALRERYTKDAPRIWALEKPAEPAPSVGAVDRDSLMAHAAWVRAGRQGRGRLEVIGYSAKGLRYGGVEFSGARLERVTFDKALLDAAQMQDAELVDVSAREAICTSIKLTAARITRGTFWRAQLALSVFDAAVVDETTFEEANFDRSTWAGANVVAASFDGCTFGNTWFDRGRFRGCTFRKADLRLLTEGIKCTTAGAVFEDCDLRFTRWDGRNLDGATFIRCKLAGITGLPSSTENMTIRDTDLSAEGDGSDIADADDVLAIWRGLS